MTAQSDRAAMIVGMGTDRTKYGYNLAYFMQRTDKMPLLRSIKLSSDEFNDDDTSMRSKNMDHFTNIIKYP